MVAALFQDRLDAVQESLASTHGFGKGCAWDRQGNGEEGLRPDLKVSKERVAAASIQPQHRGGDHREGEAAHLPGQGEGAVGCLEFLGELIHQRRDRWGVAGEGCAREQLTDDATTRFVAGAVAVGE